MSIRPGALLVSGVLLLGVITVQLVLTIQATGQRDRIERGVDRVFQRTVVVRPLCVARRDTAACKQALRLTSTHGLNRLCRLVAQVAADRHIPIVCEVTTATPKTASAQLTLPKPSPSPPAGGDDSGPGSLGDSGGSGPPSTDEDESQSPAESKHKQPAHEETGQTTPTPPSTTQPEDNDAGASKGEPAQPSPPKAEPELPPAAVLELPELVPPPAKPATEKVCHITVLGRELCTTR